MDIKVFIVISLAITTYIISGGLLFQYIERRQSVRPTISTPQLEGQRSEGGKICLDEESLANFLANFVLDDWQLNLTIQELDINRTVILLATLRLYNFEKWDFWDSIFFAETLVTTIGFGNVTPVTTIGRMIACLYSVVGIPIFCVWATSIGEIIIAAANRLRKSTKIRKKWHRLMRYVEIVVIAFVGSVIFIFVPAILFSSMEGWAYTDCIYFAVITLATIGLGDFVAGTKDEAPVWYQIFINFWLVFGLGWLSMIISLGINIFRTRAAKVVKKAEEKVAQITTEIRQRIVGRGLLGQRRNSFSGNRMVSVMHSRPPTVTAALYRITPGITRLIGRLDPEDEVDEEADEELAAPDQSRLLRSSANRNQLVRTASSYGSNSPQGPMPSWSRSRRSTIANLQDNQLPPIDELRLNCNNSKLGRRKSLYVVNERIAIETSAKRPSLGIGSATVWLFDQQKKQRSDAMAVNNAVLEQILLNNGRDNTVSPPLGMEHRQLSVSKSTRSSLRRHNTVVRTGSSANSSRRTRNDCDDDSGLVVMTDKGIAESLGSHIILIRPRSHSL